MVKRTLLSLGAGALFLMPALAQTNGANLDLYFGDWHNAPTRTVYGQLTEQDILTPGDALHPSAKGAVLRSIRGYEHTVLAPHVSTAPIKLRDRQQVYFIVSGEGTASSASQTVALSPNIAVLMPADLEFTVKNTGDQPLTMYLIEEPIQPGFHPNSAMLARDENKLPFSTTDQQWSYMVKKIFVASDGLATLNDVSTIFLDPLTVGRPHVTESPGTEAVWTALEGTGIAFVSNRLLRQTPGTAFLEVPDQTMPYSAVNPNEDAEIKFLYFVHRPPSSNLQPPK
jgi:mannose-6-phosphate isomerase-like protein (cupin superfamily)